MRGLIWCVRSIALLAVVVLAAPLGWQLITGDSYLIVTGQSMRPTLEPGDLVVVDTTNKASINTVGALIVADFTPAGATRNRFVHRVHELTDHGTVLKGDNNDAVDPILIDKEAVVGTPRMLITGRWALLYRITNTIWFRLTAAVLIGGALMLSTPKRGKHRIDTESAEANQDQAPSLASGVPSI